MFWYEDEVKELEKKYFQKKRTIKELCFTVALLYVYGIPFRKISLNLR